MINRKGALRLALGCSTALCGMASVAVAQTETATATARSAQPAEAQATNVSEVIVTVAHTTRSAVSLPGPEIQKILPGVSPLKAIETLPGVLYETADPWGNNEQNESLFVHGFTTQQLGYTMDGVPLGDQQYGNYNGLSPVARRHQRERRARDPVVRRRLAGRGVHQQSRRRDRDLLARSARAERTVDMRETVGSYRHHAAPSCALDSGDMRRRQRPILLLPAPRRQRAWDFNGHQRGDQVNLQVRARRRAWAS